MLTLKLIIKKGGASVLSTMSSICRMSSMLLEFEQQRYKKIVEKKPKKKNQQQQQQPWTLAYILVFQTLSSPLKKKFGLEKWCHVG